MATITYKVGPSGKVTIDRKVGSRLDYSLDWSDVLTPLSDTIASVDFFHSSGLTIDTSNYNGMQTLAWISGGAKEIVEWYSVTVTTNSVPPRKFVQTIYFNMIELPQ